jgi:hypothetical protein
MFAATRSIATTFSSSDRNRAFIGVSGIKSSQPSPSTTESKPKTRKIQAHCLNAVFWTCPRPYATRLKTR